MEKVELIMGPTVWIEVEGKIAAVYNLSIRKLQYGIQETSCMIEAIEGSRFRICYEKLPTAPHMQSRIEMHVDGDLVGNNAFCDDVEEGEKGSIDGYREGDDAWKATIREFRFGNVETTTVEYKNERTRSKMNEHCTIRVDFTMSRRGKKDHKAEQAPKRNQARKKIVHQDSKSATFGILTEPGDAVVRRVAGRICLCPIIGEPKLHHRLIFRYCSMKFLKPYIKAEDIRAGLIPPYKPIMEKDGAVEIDKASYEAGKRAKAKNAEGTTDREATVGRKRSRPNSDEAMREDETPANLGQDDTEWRIKREKRDVVKAVTPPYLDITGDGDGYVVLQESPPETISILTQGL